MISRDFVSRYRTLPAASWEDDLTPAAFAFLAPSDKDPAYAVICPMHNHPEPELLLVMDGTLSVRREGEHCFQTARAGDFLSFAAYEAHETAMRENDRVRAVSICFDPSLLIHPLSDASRRLAEGVSCAALYPEPRIAAEDPGCDVLRRCFIAMRDALDAPGSCRETAFLSALYELFARFEEYGYLRSSDTPADAVKEREQAFIRAVVAYTDRHFMEDLHTADTARELGYSEAYFCRLFRELFRMRYADYLCNQRITYAKVLLLSKTVTETALACGFSSISYFSSVFRRLTGMTPTEYQKNQLG